MAVGELLNGERMENKQLNFAKNYILDLFKKAINGVLNGKSISIGRLTVDGKKYLSDISGLDFKKYTDFMVNPADMRHIHKKHFGKNETDPRNYPLTDSDIKGLIDVISTPDDIVFIGTDSKTKVEQFAFLKDSGNGTYNLVEVYGNTGGKLTAKSYYHTKKGIIQRANELSVPTSQRPERSGESPSSATKIPQIIEIEPTSSNSNTTNNGEFNGSDTDIRFQSVADAANAAGSSMAEETRNELDKRLKSKAFKIREAWEDRFLAVNEFQELLREKGVEIAEHNDFYKQSTHLNGKNDAQLEVYNEKFQRPLNEVVGEIEINKKEEVECLFLIRIFRMRLVAILMFLFFLSECKVSCITKTGNDIRMVVQFRINGCKPDCCVFRHSFF